MSPGAAFALALTQHALTRPGVVAPAFGLFENAVLRGGGRYPAVAVREPWHAASLSA
jgi:hypothetical protein